MPDQNEANTTVRSEEGPVAEQQEAPATPVAVVETSPPDGDEVPRVAASQAEGLPVAADAGPVKAQMQESKEEPPPRQQARGQSPPAADPVRVQQDVTAIQAPGKPAPVQPSVAKTTPAAAHARVTPEKPQGSENSLQKNIDAFLHDYSAAYGQKNMAGFLEFFNDDATENGKSVVDLIPTYAQLFETTESIDLQISALNWQETAKDRIALHCSFEIDLAYRNANAVHGTGKIDFRLVKDGSVMKIPADELQLRSISA